MDFLYSSIKNISSRFRRNGSSSKRKTIKSRSLTPKPKNEFNVIYEDEEEYNKEESNINKSNSNKSNSNKSNKEESNINKSNSNKSNSNKSNSNKSNSNKSNSNKSNRNKSEETHSSSLKPDSILITVKSNSPKKTEEIELQFPDPLPNKISFNKKIEKRMTDLYKKHKSLKPFIGNKYFKSLFFLYLFKKYKTNCLITRNLNDFNIPGLFIVIDPKFSDLDNTSRPDFIKQFTKCISNNEAIIIIPVSIQVQHISKPTVSHANILIYRNNTRELEHFEPHGYKFGGFTTDSYTNKISDFINNYLKELVELINIELHKKKLPNIKLLEAHNVCPRYNGLQSLEERSELPPLPIEPTGYCGAWSMFFAEMCLKNPEIPSKQIYEVMLNKTDYQNKDYLRKVIRGYTCFINNKIAKYFSSIFDNNITSAKVVEYSQQEGLPLSNQTLDATNFIKDVKYIMQNESNPDSESPEEETRRYNVLSKYAKFKRSIKQDTSSSELSENIGEKSASDPNSYDGSWPDSDSNFSSNSSSKSSSKSNSKSKTKKNNSADKLKTP
jgi:hypothetical protein